jgi:3-deoxy-D-manno-octulosonic-acid transferase
MIWVYNMIQMWGVVLGLPFIFPAICLSEKHRKTVLHRLGIKPIVGISRNEDQATGKSKPIWLHALSVGEVMAAGSLVEGLAASFQNRSICFSVSTLTGFETAQRLVGEKVAAIFYFPYDLICSVWRAVQIVDPAAVIIIETDVWPNFLFAAKKKRIPVILANARISRRSFARYQQFLPLTKRLFSTLSHACVPTADDAAYFNQLGMARDQITVTGNLKFDQKHHPMIPFEINDLKIGLNVGQQQKIFVAGSTHKGEEAILIDAFVKIKQKEKDVCFIIAPRNPKRAKALTDLFQASGFSSVLFQQQMTSDPKKHAEVIVVDTLGILNQLYGISDVVFVGGSLIRFGGHNPLEPAAESKPILFGPDMSDFEAISQKLIRSKGAFVVNNVKEVSDTVVRFFRDCQRASIAGQNAFKIFDAETGAVPRTIDVVRTYLSHAVGHPHRN